MFALDPIHPIYSSIVELLAIYPGMTINELHEHLKKKVKMKVSLAHLYRTVNRMVASQILIKLNGKLSLNLMWISYVEFIAGRAKRIMSYVGEFPLHPGEKKTYTANSLLDVEAIWNHVLVSLYRTLQVKKLHKYYSHAWWQLGRNAEEIGFYQRLKDTGIECRWVFGSDTPLDRIGCGRIKEVFEAITTRKTPFPSEGYNLNVYDEYIIECILPESISRHFEFFFRRIKKEKDFDHTMFLDLFTMRGAYKVTVWRNAKQADLLREKLGSYFS